MGHFLMGMGRWLMEMSHHSIPKELKYRLSGMSHHSILKESIFPKGMKHFPFGKSQFLIESNHIRITL